MGTTNKRIKGGLPTLALVGTISATVPGIAGTLDTTGTVTAWPDGTSSRSFVIEIDDEAILCSARSGNQLTVEQRGYDNTTPAAHSNSADIDHVLDAATIQAHEDFVYSILGIASLAAGDTLYLTSASAFARLAKGAANTPYGMNDAGTAPQWGGLINMVDQILQRPILKDYAETTQALGNTGTTKTIDCEAGNVATATATGNCTWTFSNPPATGKTGTITLLLTADGTVRTHTWPASVKWAAGTAPTMTGTNGKVDVLTFITPDGGTTWYGFVGGQNF